MDLKRKNIIYKINVVIDCGDAKVLSEFYSVLLGWELTHPSEGGWAAITSPDETVIAFQELKDYEPPVWPWKKGQQGQMQHLDFWVEDLEEGVDLAIRCGAKLAEEQFFTTSRTLIDPAGHPFCIDTEGEEPNQ